jgi:glutamate dehydrogenase
VRGLLDLTDNLVGGEVVHPPGVRVLDEDDPYLVVAADKGTATFSDVANAISAEFGFWLGDAFASGGSAGYDHKALGITARGVWESVKRHFRELGRDVDAEVVTAVGIGDMSGDVFGNGMLLSSRVKLVAAFDHRHVFIDPNPDPAVSFAERKRLFELPASSWDDYDRALLSAGGGVWARTEKRIPLSPEARVALGVEAEALTPNEVLSAILCAPVDLLWNGGIGTFVKASGETHAEAGDRTNDAIRVDATRLRARVVAEGGNLGLTQRARIEYAHAGGRINADFIDNSAGVDTSDHEVNLKILLGIAVANGELTLRQRDELLREVEADVAAHVLYHNYLQAQILSQEEVVAAGRIEAYEDLMAQLETDGLLDRGIEFLPTTEEMAERRRAGRGLTRPELCVLLAYAKRSLKAALRVSGMIDDPHLDGALRAYFPLSVAERFGRLLPSHPLRRDLLATIVANDVVNSQGITFVSTLAQETGADAAAVARAFWIARAVTGAVARWADVEALDGEIDPALQNELMVGVDTLVDEVSRWYLLDASEAPIADIVAETAGAFAGLDAVIERSGSASWQAARAEAARELERRGAPAELARRHVFQPELAHVPDVLAVCKATGRTLEDVASVFFLVGERVHLDLLEEGLARLPTPSRFDRWAAQAVSDDLLALRREIARRALESADGVPPAEALERFLATRVDTEARLDRLVASLETQAETTLAALTVALRQIRSLVA